MGGEHKAGELGAWPDKAPADAMFLKKGVHAAVGPPRAKKLERQQYQERQKEPCKQAKAKQPPRDGEMIDKRRLQRRIIIRVKTGEAKPVRTRRGVRDAQPDRLHSS